MLFNWEGIFNWRGFRFKFCWFEIVGATAFGLFFCLIVFLFDIYFIILPGVGLGLRFRLYVFDCVFFIRFLFPTQFLFGWNVFSVIATGHHGPEAYVELFIRAHKPKNQNLAQVNYDGEIHMAAMEKQKRLMQATLWTIINKCRRLRICFIAFFNFPDSVVFFVFLNFLFCF